MPIVILPYRLRSIAELSNATIHLAYSNHKDTNIMLTIKLHERIEVSTYSSLTEYGVNRIVDLLESWFYTDILGGKHWFDFTADDNKLDSAFRKVIYSMRYVDAADIFVDKPTKPRFSKRIWKLFKANNIVLPDTLVQKLGETYGNNMLSGQNLEVVFTSGEHVLNSSASDYYHKNSCWWGGYNDSRHYLAYNDGGGVLLYLKGDKKPIGRAWYSPSSKDDKGLVIFNVYYDNSKASFAEIVKRALGVKYVHDVRFERGGVQGYGDVYFNTGQGYLLTDIENAPTGNHCRWNEPDYEYSEERCECYQCGNRYNTDDMYYVNDEYYCQDCYVEYLAHCHHCDDIHNIENMESINGEYVCEYCVNIHYHTCDDCNDYVHTDDSYVTGNSDVICPNCEHNYTRCENCDELYQTCDMLHNRCECCHNELVSNGVIDEEGRLYNDPTSYEQTLL